MTWKKITKYFRTLNLLAYDFKTLETEGKIILLIFGRKFKWMKREKLVLINEEILSIGSGSLKNTFKKDIITILEPSYLKI